MTRLPHRAALALLATMLAAAPAAAQPRPAPAPAPAIPERMPGTERPERSPADRSGGGPTGNDILEDNQGGGTARGVIQPPMHVDPAIQGRVPDPMPNTTPVIPPPGAPGGDPTIVPR